MKRTRPRDPLPTAAFVEKLTYEGRRRYHDGHPFHERMHAGLLSTRQLQDWVLNRYYYQTRIPIKDALILAKSEDPAFRRIWIRRIQDQDGMPAHPGGLHAWLTLARGVGLDPDEVATCRSVLPGVRRACDEYVRFVRESSLLEAVAASLTELFAPGLMAQRIQAWTRHYPWIKADALEYFHARIVRAGLDSQQAVEFVGRHATTHALQEQCLRALQKKTDILWLMLDCIHAASPSSIGQAAAQF